MSNNLPNHIAIIPDGNRRWADMKGLPRLWGHKVGAERMHQVVDRLLQVGIKYLTLWGFSSDNWKRKDEEVQGLLNLLQLWIEKDTPWLHENGVRLRHIGHLYELPQGLQGAISQAGALTSHNPGMILNLAFNYTGRAEIIDAVNKLLSEWAHTDYINENQFSRYLYTDGIPDVDLVIRTAGEYRMSNFMLWQTAYSEYYFSNVFWPDFDAIELEKALKAYSERDRRYGGD